MVISLRERMAFFVNGLPVLVVEPAQVFGGTVALGVNAGTTEILTRW